MPKTKVSYLLLIDMTPSDPDTIWVKLSEAQRSSVHMWSAMSYSVLGACICWWALLAQLEPMAETGLTDIMEAAFGRTPKMLRGKKFPQNVRALRMVAHAGSFEKNTCGKKHPLYEWLDCFLADLASKSKTAKLQIDCLIKPIFIMMMYIRGEKEAEWSLHLQAVLMLPYLFAAGHVNYARYGCTTCIWDMESLPSPILNLFMKRQQGIWNGIWSDMFTFMRYGRGPSGIIGITLRPETLKIWALDLHTCSQLASDVASLSDKEHPTLDTHKEETKSRLAADKADRNNIRNKLDMFIDPLDPSVHPNEIISISSGRLAKPSVHKAVHIGMQQLETFESSWPEGFYGKISKVVQKIRMYVLD